MSPELQPRPEHIYNQYIRAEERLRTMKQAQRELPDLALDDVQEMAAQRQQAVNRETQRLRETIEQAREYAEVNLPALKEQAAQEARSRPYHKTINPI